MNSKDSKSGTIINSKSQVKTNKPFNESEESLMQFVDPKTVAKTTMEYRYAREVDGSDQIKVKGASTNISEDIPEENSMLRGFIPQREDEKDNETRGQYYRVGVPLSGYSSPKVLIEKLQEVSYECMNYLAVQINLFLNIPAENKVKSLLLEGPSGCGKSYLAKSLAKITESELMVLSCYPGMISSHLIETPSTFAIANAMASGDVKRDELMNLGIISRAFLKSQTERVIFLIDELDKPDSSLDTFFLGPIQDATIWLESRPPIEANPDNILLIFTKNFNRTLDEALLRRVHPIKMTYLDSTLERKILSPYCDPILINNLVSIADRMRYNQGTYAFDRPPAPEELLLTGKYVVRLLEWNMTDFATVGESVFNILSKSEHDRAVFEHMLRFHPEYMDPLWGDPKNATRGMIFKRLGQVILEGLVYDPESEQRSRGFQY